MEPFGWLTNDPGIAKRLRAIDRAHKKARDKAKGWALVEKLAAYRKADSARDEAYERIKKELEGKK